MAAARAYGVWPAGLERRDYVITQLSLPSLPTGTQGQWRAERPAPCCCAEARADGGEASPGAGQGRGRLRTVQRPCAQAGACARATSSWVAAAAAAARPGAASSRRAPGREVPWLSASAGRCPEAAVGQRPGRGEAGARQAPCPAGALQAWRGGGRRGCLGLGRGAAAVRPHLGPGDPGHRQQSGPWPRRERGPVRSRRRLAGSAPLGPPGPDSTGSETQSRPSPGPAAAGSGSLFPPVAGGYH